MSRPTTKVDLIEQASEKFYEMYDLINSIPEEEMVALFNYDEKSLGKEAHWKRDKNIRDVLVHLYEWHQLLLNWVISNQSGQTKPFLPSPYNWKTYGDMNIEFFEKHQNTEFETSSEMLKKSHSDVMKMIETFSCEQLFAKKQYSWTGTTTLGSYCVSATSSHYDWAIKKIKKHIKSN